MSQSVPGKKISDCTHGLGISQHADVDSFDGKV